MTQEPSDLAWNYMKLPIDTETNGRQWVAVERYLSKSKFLNSQTRKAAYDSLLRFYSKTKDSGGQVRYRHGIYHDPAFWPTGTLTLDKADLYQCFLGKGQPGTFLKALRLIDHYLNRTKDISKLWTRKPTLQEYATWYLGLDCNGFVGAWFLHNYPAAKIDGNVHINYWRSKSRTTDRNSVSEVKPFDVLVRTGPAGERHIAIVEDVLSVSDNKAEVLVTQSASSLNGLDWDVYTLESKKKPPYGDGKPMPFTLHGYYDFHYLLRHTCVVA